MSGIFDADVKRRALVRKWHSQRYGTDINEWEVIELNTCNNQPLKPGDVPDIVLGSRNHDDDVWLYITGNFDYKQKRWVADELCAQLNMIENLQAEKFKDEL
jgi:hypothetical protein